MLTSLNTPTIANAGAGLATSSTTALGGMVVSLSTGGHPSPVALTAAFVGIVVGVALAYVGRPSTIKAVPAGQVASGGDTTIHPIQAATPQEK
jgi:hypothetical protein